MSEENTKDRYEDERDDLDDDLDDDQYDERDERDERDEPRAPTDYNAVPFLRRNGFCSGVCLAHLGVMLLSGCVPLIGLLGIFTTLGILVVCFVVLTGPVYYNKRKKDGTLKVWEKGNKIAAVILLVLFVGGYAVMVAFAISQGVLG